MRRRTPARNPRNVATGFSPARLSRADHRVGAHQCSAALQGGMCRAKARRYVSLAERRSALLANHRKSQGRQGRNPDTHEITHGLVDAQPRVHHIDDRHQDKHHQHF